MNSISGIHRLHRGAEMVIPVDGLEDKIMGGRRRLIVKVGMDPTAPNLHLGHAVILSKLREFQDLGHKIVFIIGDFTARIGDPTGRSKTRPPLDEKTIQKNTETYFDQVSLILDRDKIDVRYNSEWLSKLRLADVTELMAKFTVAALTERADFAERLRGGVAVGLHELMYPVMQAYDSVVLDADVEVGGTDQIFNMLCGRELQKKIGKERQIVLAMPLLEGLDGIRKMSKSYGNTVDLTDTPEEVFGKLMSISDKLICRYGELLLHWDIDRLETCRIEVAGSDVVNPMKLKKEMAEAIIERFWSKEGAAKARANFEAIFQRGDYSKAEEVRLDEFTVLGRDGIWIVDLLKKVKAAKTSSEVKRLAESGAIELDGKKIVDFRARVDVSDGATLRVGKHRIFKLKIV